MAIGGKEPTCQCRRHKRNGFDPCFRKIPWRREWQPTPVFLPGEFHRQRSLAGYSPWGCKELDTIEQLTHTYLLPPQFTNVFKSPHPKIFFVKSWPFSPAAPPPHTSLPPDPLTHHAHLTGLQSALPTHQPAATALPKPTEPSEPCACFTVLMLFTLSVELDRTF